MLFGDVALLPGPLHLWDSAWVGVLLVGCLSLAVLC